MRMACCFPWQIRSRDSAIAVNGFHDNDYTYYDRNTTHPALGYEWIASGNGLEYQTDENGQDMWPQSDLVMIEETFDKYTETQPRSEERRVGKECRL